MIALNTTLVATTLVASQFLAKGASAVVLVRSSTLSKVILVFAAVLLVATKLVFSAECSIFFGHILIVQSSLALFKFIVASFFVVVFAISARAKYSSAAALNTLTTYLFIFLMVVLLWVSNTALSFIFVIDSLNLLLYKLFFEQKTKNVSSHCSSVSVYFWVSFFATALFFALTLQLYLSAYTLDVSLAFIILSISVQNSIKTLLFSLTFFVFVFIKLGLAPFFFWKYGAIKSMSVNTALFYVCFYFSFVFLFFIKVLIFSGVYLVFNTAVLYILLFCMLTLLCFFKTAGQSIARALAFSTALNGFFVCCMCCMFLLF